MMAQTTTLARPTLVQPRAAEQLEAVRSMTGGSFDVDAWHVMDARDDQLVADEILNGAGSHTFVYSFNLAGTEVSGVSVVGARHLAAHYRGLKHRLVASTHKVGELFTFTSYPAENMPMSVSCAVVHELSGEPDYYSIIVEMSDIKTGNSIQVERREPRFERRRDGSQYERPNYPTIAQSKAFRNSVLSLVPQDVLIMWREQMLKLKKGETITADVLGEKRRNVIRFAAQHGLALERQTVDRLTLDQIAGLGDAAREGRLPAFVNAAKGLGLEVANEVPAAEAEPEPTPAPRQRRARPRSEAAGNPAPVDDDPPPEPQDDPPPPEPEDDPPPAAAAARRLSFE